MNAVLEFDVPENLVSLERARKGLYEHFHLSEAPFRDTVNPRFLFRTARLERVQLQLQLFLEERDALAVVTGPSGTGKTLLMQCLLEEMDEMHWCPVSLFATPGMTLSSLLYELAYELRIDFQGFRRQVLLEQIHERVLAEAGDGRRVVVMLDEAHFLSSSGLHLLRTLTNLESREEKWLSLILFGEEGLLRRLKHKSYDSLRSRVSLHVSLERMSREETEQYVKFRVLVAGGKAPVFTKEAFDALHEWSTGVPRRVSHLATSAMREAYLDDVSVVDSQRVRRAAEHNL